MAVSWRVLHGFSRCCSRGGRAGAWRLLPGLPSELSYIPPKASTKHPQWYQRIVIGSRETLNPRGMAVTSNVEGCWLKEKGVGLGHCKASRHKGIKCSPNRVKLLGAYDRMLRRFPQDARDN